MVKLKTVWDDWKERRFLKKHHCDSRKEYERKYDPRIFFPAGKVSDFYYGYKYILPISRNRDLDYWAHMNDLDAWCLLNCQGKYRTDIFRVSESKQLNNKLTEDWFFDEMGGGDIGFVAFTDELDVMWFKLRWA